MTEEEIKKKAEEYAKSIFSGNDKDSAYYQQLLFTAYKDGYEQGISEKQLIVKIATDKNNELYEENELLKSKIKNVYEVRQKAQSEMISNLEKENEKLKAKIEKMKCCENCNKNRKAKCDDNLRVLARINRICDKWELAE